MAAAGLARDSITAGSPSQSSSQTSCGYLIAAHTCCCLQVTTISALELFREKNKPVKILQTQGRQPAIETQRTGIVPGQNWSQSLLFSSFGVIVLPAKDLLCKHWPSAAFAGLCCVLGLCLQGTHCSHPALSHCSTSYSMSSSSSFVYSWK